MRAIALIATLVCTVSVVGCATPTVVLKHNNGQTVQCGGQIVGSIVGGVAGHQLQKKQDQDCVKKYEADGYQRMQ